MIYCDEAKNWTKNMKINICGNRACEECKKSKKEGEEKFNGKTKM